MKHSILGFSQLKMVELGISLDEALILRYFIDFKDTGKMIKVEEDGQQYYWVKYEAIKESLPLLKISKDSIYRKLKNLVKVGVLKHKTVSNFGTYSFYGIGDKYIELIDDDPVKNDPPGPEDKNNDRSENIPNPRDVKQDTSEKNPSPYGKYSDTPTGKNPTPLGKFSRPKDISFNNISFKDNKSNKDIYINIVGYLNEKVGTNYKATSKKTKQLINSRLSDGFTENDFKVVIDKKVGDWKNTDMSKYLRPETLFGTKFEGYLNQKTVKTVKQPSRQQSQFGNYEQRQYDFNELERKLLGWDRVD